MEDQNRNLTSNHWGLGIGETENGRLVNIKNHPFDPAPPQLNANMAGSLNGKARVLRPAIRQSWLEGRKGERGRDPFVEVSWDDALDLIATELTRVRETHGNHSIFAGSYGWGSAGRFHHAQSQLKRFLNTQGGFVRSEGNYSYNAALVAMPHIVGGAFRQHLAEATRLSVVAKHTELMVMFGGFAMRNTQICDGGNSKHRIPAAMDDCVKNGVKFINISPLRSDADPHLNAEWLAPKPGSDTAVMMGLAHSLLSENLHDTAFLNRYTVGFDKFAAYLRGEPDGQEKSADWAAEISGLDAERIRELAREMAEKRTMITCAAGLQRADWGEQPLWMIVTLAAMLGQIGLPGGGYTIGYAVNGHVGTITRPFGWGNFTQLDNPVRQAIPVAMIAEALLNPNATYRYDGQIEQLPDIRLLWWAGGNPFHHHQDLNRLHDAFQTPETVIVNEINWTAAARHADIVLPVAATPERHDFGAGKTDNTLIPMHKIAEPPGQAREEFDIYCDLANRLDDGGAFSAGLTSDEWLRKIWEKTRNAGAMRGQSLPDWDSFLSGGPIELPDPSPDCVFLADFRADPIKYPRPTPSGRIEIFSEVIAGFDLPECRGHATWTPPRDQSQDTQNKYPLALISGQPGTRLHSQFDNGALSLSQKVAGREPVLINPLDAAARGISDGDVVELFNSRGTCLAGARVSEDIAQGCLFLWTGAWYDPDFDHPQNRDRHGNPNVLTHDLRTSEFSQSPAAHSAQVELRRFDGEPPRVLAHDPPEFVKPSQTAAWVAKRVGSLK